MRRVFSIVTFIGIGMLLAAGLQRAQLAIAESSLKPEQDESVGIRLGRAHVALAKLELRRALAANKRLPETYSNEYIDKLKIHVAVDEAQLERDLRGDTADAQELFIRDSEAAIKLAEADLKLAMVIRQSSLSAENNLNVERAKIVLGIAKLNLENARAVDSSQAAVSHLQAQIGRLRHQVLDLQMRH